MHLCTNYSHSCERKCILPKSRYYQYCHVINSTGEEVSILHFIWKMLYNSYITIRVTAIVQFSLIQPTLKMKNVPKVKCDVRLDKNAYFCLSFNAEYYNWTHAMYHYLQFQWRCVQIGMVQCCCSLSILHSDTVIEEVWWRRRWAETGEYWWGKATWQTRSKRSHHCQNDHQFSSGDQPTVLENKSAHLGSPWTVSRPGRRLCISNKWERNCQTASRWCFQ